MHNNKRVLVRVVNQVIVLQCSCFFTVFAFFSYITSWTHTKVFLVSVSTQAFSTVKAWVTETRILMRRKEGQTV